MEQRQLDLREPKRKGRKLPPPKEILLHCQLAALLRQFANSAWRYTHLPMGEYRTPETARKLRQMGVTAGWPDFIFVGPGAAFFLELKRAGSRLSDAQIDMRTHLIRCGARYLVTSNLDDAVSTLQDLSILPRGIRVQ
jgi:hypothetical protein